MQVYKLSFCMVTVLQEIFVAFKNLVQMAWLCLACRQDNNAIDQTVLNLPNSKGRELNEVIATATVVSELITHKSGVCPPT